jgi:hypothetical protein
MRNKYTDTGISTRRDDSDNDVSIYTATTVEPGYSADAGRDIHRVVGRIGMTKPREVSDEAAMNEGQLFRQVPAQVTHMQVSEEHLPVNSDARFDFLDDAMNDAQKLYGQHPIPHADYEQNDPFKNVRQFVVDDKTLNKLGTDVTWKRHKIPLSVQFDRFSDGSVVRAGEGYTQLKFSGM